MRNGSGLASIVVWVGGCWLAAVGLAVAVTTTWRPGTLPIDGIGQRLELQLPDWILIALAVAAAAAGLTVLSTLIPAPRRKDPEDFALEPPPPPRLSPVVLAVWFLLLAIVVAGIVLCLRLLDIHHADGMMAPPSGIGAVPPGGQPGPARGAVHAGAVDWGLSLALGAVAAVISGCALVMVAVNQPWAVLAQWFRLRRRRKPALALDLAAAVSAGMRDLEAAHDPRRAVIACYRRCEAALASRRRRRHPAETPREFVADALAALRLPAAAIRSLLAVVERARFSDLPITPGDRDAALRAFGDIRSVLERTGQDGTTP